MRPPILILPILVFAIFVASCAAPRSTTANSPLELLPERPEKGTIFKYYRASGESPRKENWAAVLDFSGISWNDTRCATLISPVHVVMAAHYIRDSRTPAIFHDWLGQPEERFILSQKVIEGTDIAVGKLNMPMPSGYRTYRFAGEQDATPGTPVITTDQTYTASIHQIRAVVGKMIAFEYVETIDPIYRRNLIPGDSGHPTFVLKNGELLLLETHTTGGPGAGPFYGNPEVQQAIRAAMKELGN